MISFQESNTSNTNNNNNNTVKEKSGHRFQITKASKTGDKGDRGVEKQQQNESLTSTSGSLKPKSQVHDQHQYQYQQSQSVASNPTSTAFTGGNGPSSPQATTPTAAVLFNTVENNENICSHLYTTAYLNGLYSDLIVRIAFQGPQQNKDAKNHSNNLDGVSFKLHKIMAIRSPVLARLMKEVGNPTTATTGQPLNLQLTTSDPFLTRQGLGIAFGHLYASYAGLLMEADGESGTTASGSFTEERTLMLRSVLSAARLLELPDLSRLCIEYMRQLIKMDSVVGMAKFLSCADGASEAGGVGVALQDLKDAVFTYLCKEFLDDVLERKGVIWGGNPGAKGHVYCVQTFAQLPFEWIKGVVESKYFDAPSEMERFNFAKAVVDLRAYQNTKNSATGHNAMLAGAENVLLSFGGKSTGVTLVRKPVGAAGHSNLGGANASATERRVWKVSQSQF